MKLAVIILNWRTPAMTLDAATAAIVELQRLEEPWRLIIVDNDSQDGSFETMTQQVDSHRWNGVAGWEHVEVIASGRNGGFGAGNNYGIVHALGSEDPPEYVHILNSDAFPDPRSVEHLVDYLDAHPDVAIAGSYIHGTDGQPHVTAFRFPSLGSEIEGSLRLGVISRLLADSVVPIGIPPRTQEVDWLAGASMMIRASVIREVGMFDETFFLYFEETDLCRRVREAGHKIVYVKESSVAHIGSASTGMKTWKRVPDYWFDSRRHYFIKNHGWAYFAAATAALAVGTGIWDVRRRIQKKPDENPPGFLRGLLRRELEVLRTTVVKRPGDSPD